MVIKFGSPKMPSFLRSSRLALSHATRAVGKGEEIEALVLYGRTPESLKPLRLTPGSQKLGDGLLRYRVMMAVVWSLVYPAYGRFE